MINRLTGTLDFQTDALVLRAERQRLIASNIANADTPGYVSRDFDFAQALRQAARDSGSTGTGTGTAGALGDPIAGGLLGGGLDGTRQAIDLRYAMPAQTSLDSNTVDMDRERASFADNGLKYEATLRFINADVRNLSDAMKSPSQG